MISKELEYDLRQISQFGYCFYGRDKYVENIKAIKDHCTSKEAKEIFKIILNQVKIIDKRMEEYYKQYYEQYVDYKAIE